MAKKVQPSVETAFNDFKEVMERSGLNNFIHYNRIMMAQNPKGQNVIIIPELALWNRILDDEEWKKKVSPANNEEDSDFIRLTQYCDELDSVTWIQLDADQLYAGDVIKFEIKNGDTPFEYDFSITKALIPVKLRKKEYTDIAYKVIIHHEIIVAIKKYFPHEIQDCGYTTMRLFQAI